MPPIHVPMTIAQMKAWSESLSHMTQAEFHQVVAQFERSRFITIRRVD